MAQQNTDFGKVADDLRRAASSFALLTSSATVFGASLNAFREFEKNLVSTNAVALGNVQTYNQMSQAVRTFAKATTTSTSEAIGALQNLAQAGFTAQESLQAMSGVLLLASATMTDVGVTADLISSNIRAFGLEAADATRISNLFAAAVVNGLASMDKLTFALRQVGPVADVANLSIEETTAYLNELFNVGLRGEQAGTALRNVIVRLVRPTGQAAKILRDIGVATVDATGNFRGLEVVLGEIASKNLGEASLATIFENEALAGALTLMKSVTVQNGKLTSSYQAQLKAISGTQRALELALQNLNTFDGSMKLFRNTVNDLAISIGEALAPTIRELATFLTDLINTFQSLDPETKAFYTRIAAVAAALIGSLAALNAFILLFGSGIGAIAAFGKALYTLDAGFALTFLGKGLLVFSLIEIAAQFSSLPDLIGQTGTAIAAASLTAAFFLPGGPLIVGVTLLTAAILEAANAWGVFDSAAIGAEKNAAKKIAESAASESIKLDTQGLTQQMSQVDALLKQAADMRSSALVKAIAGNGDLPTFIDALQGSQNKAREAILLAEQNEKDLTVELNKLGTFQAEYRAALEEAYKNNDGAEVTLGDVLFYTSDEFQQFLIDNPENSGIVQEIQRRFGQSSEQRVKALEAIKGAQSEEEKQIAKYLGELQEGKQKVGPLYDDLTDTIKGILAAGGPELQARLSEFLAAQDGPFTIDKVIAAIFTDPSLSIDPGLLNGILTRQNQEQVRKVVTDLQSIATEIAQQNEELRIGVLEFTAKNSSSLTEAIGAGLEAGNAKVELDLEKTLKKFVTDHGDAISQVITQNSAETQKAIEEALKAGGYVFKDNPGIDELIGGRGLIEAIQARVDADTTPEELQKIALEEGAKYAAVLQNMLIEIAKASGGAIDPAQLAQLQAIVAGQIKGIQDAVVNGATSIATGQGAIEERIKKEAESLEKEADKALKKAKEALKRAREIADLFREIETQLNDARKGFVTAVRGLTVDERIKVDVEFDLADINTRADQAIEDLNRKFEDLSLTFEGTPQQLAQLKDSYGVLIDQVNATRDAELAAAQSFTASMERRSASIKLFVRDLNDMGIASKDTFTQVGAGIAAAFAEYQDDLVTLIDITKDATTDLLDTLTTGIGDFIFDNENAWENFKKSILKISREIFEGFTRSLLQQATASLTGGGGSILGNQAQPSPYGSSPTTPGTGGLLGKLFPGLAGMFGGVGTPGGQKTTNPMQTVLEQQAQETSILYKNHQVQLRAVFDKFVVDMSATLNGVVTSLQTAGGAGGASGLGGMFGGLGAAASAAFPQASAALSGAFGAASDVGGQLVQGAVGSLQDGIIQTAKALKINPLDLATVISYETGGTFNPLQKGPTTQYGQHQGLIQFGEPQAQQFGADFSSAASALTSQLGPNGAIVKYLTASGFKPGMSMLDLYSTINAGAPGRYNASDANNGGAPGTVADKVNNQMAGHLANAEKLFGDFNTGLGGVVSDSQQLFDQFGNLLTGAPKAGQPTYDAAGKLITPNAGPYVNPADTARFAAPAVAGAPALGGTVGAPGATPNDPLQASAQQFQQLFTSFLQSLTTAINTFGQQFSQALNAAIQSVGGTGSVSFNPISLAGGAGGIGGGFGGGGGGGGGFNPFKLLTSFFGFADGGYTGDGGKYDPAGIVHAGEFVAHAKATKEFLPLLEAINAGKIDPAMADTVMRTLVGKKTGYYDGGYVSDNIVPNGLRSFAGDSGGMVNPLFARKERESQQPVSVNVNYYISGAQEPDKFGKSASQHSKQLMGHIERSKRNT